jgi:hypothetical protein
MMTYPYLRLLYVHAMPCSATYKLLQREQSRKGRTASPTRSKFVRIIRGPTPALRVSQACVLGLP